MTDFRGLLEIEEVVIKYSHGTDIIMSPLFIAFLAMTPLPVSEVKYKIFIFKAK